VILDCNRCTTKFQVDPTILGRAGRVVRCSACGNLWHQDPPPGLFPEPSPEEREAAGAQPGAARGDAGTPFEPAVVHDDPLAAHLQAAGVDPGNQPPFPLRKEVREAAAAEAAAVQPEQPTSSGNGPGGNDWPEPVASWSGAGATETEGGGKRASIRPLSKLKRDSKAKGRHKERKEVPWQRWAALFAFLCAAVVLVVTSSETVVRIWPATARLYALLDMPTPLDALGLQARDARSYERVTAEGRVLVVEGRVLNTAAEARRPPKLWAVVLADGKEIASFAIKPTARSIAPGESVPFRGELANPPATAKSLKLDFRP
jgi:predicted Zn finger-like uncharacterized protein